MDARLVNESSEYCNQNEAKGVPLFILKAALQPYELYRIQELDA